jgi:hypothetical protein
VSTEPQTNNAKRLSRTHAICRPCGARRGQLVPLGTLLLGALLYIVVEQAEGATFRVRNLNDSGPGSLR